MSGLPPRIRALLWAHTTLVLATTGDNRPAIASVFYAPEQREEGVRLVCALLASSHKLANLRAHPRVAVYIGPREPTRWLQAAGEAAEVQGEAAATAAIARLAAHAPPAKVFLERVPVVPVYIVLGAIRLTDLTGERPPFEMWPEGSRLW